MDNQELAKAIDVAHMNTRATSQNEDSHGKWLAHLTALLAEQLKRARSENET